MLRDKIKINLLTFNSALSYGAVLQTYALINVLEDLNCDVELIDFRAPFLPPIPTGWWTLKTYYTYSRLRKEILFHNFRKKYLYKKTKAFFSYAELRKYKFNADYYVVGSDQVWNPDITKKYALAYFLDFVDGMKFSYGASFGKEDWSCHEKFNLEVARLLHKFQAISVRESNSVTFIKEKFNLPSLAVLDPTLLYKRFPDLLPSIKQKNQIVAFKLKYDDSFFDLISDIKKQLQIPTAYAIDTDRSYQDIISVPFPSVEEWIKYIAESSLVITDSFHGVIFSILFRKNFFVINVNPERFIRIWDLLTKLDLADRIIQSGKDCLETTKWKEPIDYIKVEQELEKHQNQSSLFLKSMLNG